jgi:hypothetical protein
MTKVLNILTTQGGSKNKHFHQSGFVKIDLCKTTIWPNGIKHKRKSFQLGFIVK